MNLIKFYQVFTFLQIYELLEYKCRENNFDGGVPVGTVHVLGKKIIYHFNKYYCCHDHNYSGCNFLQIFTCLIAYGTFYEICFSRFVSGRTLSVRKINMS